MKTPRFTDLHRYPNGYTPARETDVTGTWKKFGFDPNAAPQEAILDNSREKCIGAGPAVAAPLKFRRKA